MSPTPPNGLLLAGGRSSRMRHDKATLSYDGQIQLERATKLLSQFCPNVHLSLRKNQNAPVESLNLPIIADAFGEIGPLGGILSAFASKPEHAWLVLACDLPFLGEDTLKHLLEERDTKKLATAYSSSHDGLPEPLCAIYEPSAARQLNHFFQEKKLLCPRKILMQTEPKLIDPLDQRALDNINTPEEYQNAVAEFFPQR
ncbi:MAG: molybdenum cofactor guanylyltransferase [Opitutae bacterium]|nr:molybdenum cofactor guanylyltransferase [Opitutae bacterium]|tara:strand:- start:924 stop:1523 length:600 start_codon:yes stop_codon:yes gene_type:complete